MKKKWKIDVVFFPEGRDGWKIVTADSADKAKVKYNASIGADPEADVHELIGESLVSIRRITRYWGEKI